MYAAIRSLLRLPEDTVKLNFFSYYMYHENNKKICSCLIENILKILYFMVQAIKIDSYVGFLFGTLKSL